MSARYAVGIDLGTTNSAIAAIDLAARRRAITSLPVPQLVAEGRVGERPTLPSALYLAGAHDAPVGELARIEGGRVPGRLVTSAKSWLAHGGVDRTAKILPWGASDDDVPRVSPVAASARFLAHLR